MRDFNIDNYKTVDSLERVYKRLSIEFEEVLSDYNDLVKGKYTDANADMEIMKRAIDERNASILEYKKMMFEVKKKFSEITTHIDFKE